jgi:hypothetical protein
MLFRRSSIHGWAILICAVVGLLLNSDWCFSHPPRVCCCPGSARGPESLFEWGLETEAEPNDSAEEERPLELDRPDFTEASTTVGLGRTVIESGYTFSLERSGGITGRSHSYPETLVRAGMFADWFEFRIGQNFASLKLVGPFGSTSASGAEDLYLGCKLQLVKQQAWLPEAVIISQMTVPTGSRNFTGNQVLPGLALDYSWQITDRLDLGASTVGNGVVDVIGQPYLEVAQSAALHFKLTHALTTYVETYGLFPHHAQGVSPQYYADGGFSLMVTDDLEVDIRAGVGLNEQADNFFTGIGGGVRF